MSRQEDYTIMSNCDHDQCEPYRRCQAATLAERKEWFWLAYRKGLRPESLATDPIGWLEGAVSD